MAISVAVAGDTFVALRFESVHLPGRPARFSVSISLSEQADPDELASWLGQEVTVSGEGAAPWSETRRVVRLRAEDAEVTLWGEGASGALDDRPALSAWVDVTPADVAKDILDRSGAEIRVSLASSGANASAPYFVQYFRTDREFLGALARAYGFAVIDMDDGGVAIADAPPGESHALDGEAMVRCRLIHELQLPVSERQRSVFEENGSIELLEASAAAAPPATAHDDPASLPGFTPSPDHLMTLLEGHADAAGVFHLVRLVLPEANLRVGDLVDGESLPQTMAVIGRKTRLEAHGIVSTVDLVERERFAAAIAAGSADVVEPPRSPGPAPFTVATVAESPHPDLPGWCSVVVPGVGDEASPFPAQLLAWGGGAEGGPSWLPAPGGAVLVAFAGDALMPRLVVLGVLRHKENPPAVTDADACVLRFGQDEDGSMLRLSADGTFALRGAEIQVDATRIAFRADEIELVAPTIAMKRG